MTIQPSTSSFYTTFQASLHASQNLNTQALPVNAASTLSAELENPIQKNINDLFADQVDNIKSNYQSAKDIGLTRQYYEQQQKVIDAYMKSYSDEVVVSENSNKSAIETLNDTYATLYELHHIIKRPEPKLPDSEDIELLSDKSPQSLTQLSMDKYNSIMMPSNASHIHLSA